jgi:hypothetical protein
VGRVLSDWNRAALRPAAENAQNYIPRGWRTTYPASEEIVELQRVPVS